jgi:competence protein ComEC
LFALLAGAQASILRSAVMFTCIVLGQALGRTNNSIYNTLAVSALLLLCINPFWLWDVGFQLSYAAVLSIVVFMRPIYNWLYFKNKAIDFLWKLNAVTLAAQILTVPLSIYHFHQFPNYFLITNFIAVPLSSLILLGEIFLCTVAFIPALANITGKVLTWLISIMNGWIEKINSISYSIWDSLHISLTQMVLLLVCIAGFSFWLLEKSKIGLKTGFISLLFFVVLRSIDFYKSSRQQKIVVYNVPQHKAIDFIDGRRYFFEGDPELSDDDFLRNFHLKPSRILHRISTAPDLNFLFRKDNMADFLGKKILMIDSSTQYKNYENRQEIDLVIVSKNPRLYFSQLASTFTIKQVVFDASCPAWKLTYWKKDCDSLHIPWYDVAEKGAFVMKF